MESIDWNQCTNLPWPINIINIFSIECPKTNNEIQLCIDNECFQNTNKKWIYNRDLDRCFGNQWQKHINTVFTFFTKKKRKAERIKKRHASASSKCTPWTHRSVQGVAKCHTKLGYHLPIYFLLFFFFFPFLFLFNYCQKKAEKKRRTRVRNRTNEKLARRSIRATWRMCPWIGPFNSTKTSLISRIASDPMNISLLFSFFFSVR